MEQPGHDLARFDDLYFTLNGYSALEWLYEGDGTTPRIADDYTDAFTRAYGAWYEDSNGDLQHAASDVAVLEYSSGTYLGYRQEPQRQNKVTAYNVIGQDQDGTDSLSGWDFTVGWGTAGVCSIDDSDSFTSTGNAGITLASAVTTGKRYTITVTGSTTSSSFTIYDGSIGVLYGTGFGTHEFTAAVNETLYLRNVGNGTTDITTLTLQEIGGTELNSDGTSEGTFVSGFGEGAQAAFNTTWSQPFTNITISGGQDGVSTATIFDDSAKIPTGDRDYSNLNVSGKVLKVVAGNADTYLDYTGALSAADHAISVIARGDSAADDDITCETDNVGGSAQDLTNEYARYAETITALLADKTRLTISAGDTVYLFLAQGELGSAVTSEIITQGSAVTRAVDDLQLPVADGVNFRQSEGMLIFKIVPRFNAADISTDIGVLSVDDSATSICYYDGTNLYVTDGTNTASVAWAAVSGTEADIYVRWGNGTIQIGVDGSSGSTANYDGAFTITGGNWRFGYSATEALNLYNIRVLRVDRGSTYGDSQTADIWNPSWYERLAVADDYYELLAVNQ